MQQKRAVRPSREEAESRAPRNGTVTSTIAILRLLAAERRGLGVNAIARQLELTPSSCFNILKTLTAEEFVYFDETAKLYTLGGGLIAVARHALDPNAAFDLIRSRIEALADGWSLTAGLWGVQNGRLVLVGYISGARMMRIHLAVGQRLPMLMGSIGRSVAAVTNVTKAEIAREFPKLRWQEPPTLNEYHAQVEEARVRGWGADHGNFIRGATSLAVPILHPDGSIRYCLSVTMFSGQHSDAELPALAEEMRHIASWASTQLFTP